MFRLLSRLGAVLAAVLLLTAVQTGPASAADAEGCRIAPGSTFTFSPFCVNDRAATSYTVAFHAPAGTSYAWTVTGDWNAVWTGCGPTNAYCTVTTGGSGQDREVQAYVTVDGTVSGYYSAYIRAYCGRYLC